MNNFDESIKTIIIGKRSNLSYKLSKKLECVEVLSSESLLKSLSQLDRFKRQTINIVFNNFQTAPLLKSFSNPVSYLDVSISLTIRILEYIVKNDITINKIIYTSSSSVYGVLSTTNEDAQLCPVGIPASLKYLNEQFLKKICCEHGLNYTITRIFNMYGGNDKFSVIGRISDCYENKTVLTLFNNGKSVRDFIHIDNVVDVYEKLLLDSTVNFRILNIGSGHGQSLSKILKKISENGYSIETSSTLVEEIAFSEADITKLQTIVNVSSFIKVSEYLLNKFDSEAL